MLSKSVLALGLRVVLTASAEPISLQCPARYLGERHVIDRAPAGWDRFVAIEKGSLLRLVPIQRKQRIFFELGGRNYPEARAANSDSKAPPRTARNSSTAAMAMERIFAWRTGYLWQSSAVK